MDKKIKKEEISLAVDQLVSQTYSGLGKGLTFIKKTKIKTWQGIFILALAAGAAVACVFIVMADYYESSRAAVGEATLSLVPADSVVGEGWTFQQNDTFDVDVVLDALENNVVAVKADVRFDTTAFELQSCSTADSPFGVNDNCTNYQSASSFQIVDDSRASGKIVITQSKTGQGVQNASGHIATLTFRALKVLSATDTALTLNFSSGYNDSDVIVYGNTGDDILNTVYDPMITVTAATTYSCTGSTPSNATLCSGDDSDLTANVANSVVSGCTTAKCEYTCNSGYYKSGSSCVAYACTGTLPSGASLCSGDDTGLTANTAYSQVTTCTSGTKCEYTISSTPSCTGVAPSNAVLCSGDDTGLSVDTAKTLVSSCGSSTKCEYTCNSGYYKSGSSCAAYACTGSIPMGGSLCSGDGAGLTSSVAYSLVTTCTSGIKCEYTISSSTDTDTTIADGNVDVDAKLRGADKKDKSMNTNKDKIHFNSKENSDPDLAGGKVVIYEGDDKVSETTINSDGSWSLSAKSVDDGSHDYVLKYYNSAGTQVGQSSKYKVSVDTKDPKFTDLPLIINKRPGDIVWWKAKDNKKIDHYKYYFDGKTKETKKDSFVIPANTSKGAHYLKIKVFDKAGNSDTRNVVIRVH